jgi:hypothetical protein
MTHDDPSPQGHENHESDQPGHDSAGPITIATTDPAIETAVEHPSDWKSHPDATVRVETTQVSEPSPLHVAGARSVAAGGPSRQNQGEKNQGETKNKNKKDNGPGQKRDEPRGQRGDDDDRDDRDEDQAGRGPSPRPQQPSTMKHLAVTAGVALLCGVVGAMGYSHFFGPKSDESSTAKEADAKKKSTGGGSGSTADSDKELSSSAVSAATIPGFTASTDAVTLKRQIMDLMQRVDRLGERVDRMSRPKDETPPVLRTMQIKMGELARELDEVATLPARVRHLDNRLATFQEDLKILRARMDAMRGASPSSEGVGSLGMNLSSRLGALSNPGDPGSNQSPTMELGIVLLERGQFASAREIFQRLQVAQPGDARVWYLSALAEALTSGDWNGEAKKLAEKGLECERNGTPSTDQIDAALATRAPLKWEDQIASLRRRVLGGK